MVFPRVGTTEYVALNVTVPNPFTKLTFCFAMKTLFKQPLTSLTLASFKIKSSVSSHIFDITFGCATICMTYIRFQTLTSAW